MGKKPGSFSKRPSPAKKPTDNKIEKDWANMEKNEIFKAKENWKKENAGKLEEMKEKLEEMKEKQREMKDKDKEDWKENFDSKKSERPERPQRPEKTESKPRPRPVKPGFKPGE